MIAKTCKAKDITQCKESGDIRHGDSPKCSWQNEACSVKKACIRRKDWTGKDWDKCPKHTQNICDNNTGMGCNWSPIKCGDPCKLGSNEGCKSLKDCNFCKTAPPAMALTTGWGICKKV